MPTEQEMTENPHKTFDIGNNTIVWYDDDNEVFCAAEADCGDCGDSFMTYEELVENA